MRNKGALSLLVHTSVFGADKWAVLSGEAAHMPKEALSTPLERKHPAGSALTLPDLLLSSGASKSVFLDFVQVGKLWVLSHDLPAILSKTVPMFILEGHGTHSRSFAPLDCLPKQPVALPEGLSVRGKPLPHPFFIHTITADTQINGRRKTVPFPDLILVNGESCSEHQQY